MNFTNQSSAGTGPITSYFYDFGNTFSDTVASPRHIFRSPGTFDVKLIVTDVNGCQDIEEKKSLVTVLPVPDADFTSGNQVGCSFPHAVNFINTTTPNATGNVSYTWSFGNGNFSTVKAPSTTYNGPGNYTVRLIATNSLGCIDTMTKPGFINVEVAKASFNSNPNIGCPPLLVNFSSTSTPVSTGNSYQWSFGSVATSKASDTSVSFRASGNYSVKLVLTTPNGCKDSIVKTNLVQVSPGPNASFFANDSTACKAPHTVQFTSKSTTGVSYEWTFGDGTTSTQKNPSITYPDTGKFDVSLKVTGANGCVDFWKADEMIKVGPPRADFKPSVLEGCADLQVGFSNTTISYAPLSKVEYKFGDGGRSFQSFPNYTYKDTGLFVPWIYVTTDDGCVDSAMYDTIGVGMQPTANFTVDNTVGCRNQLKVKFTSLTNMGNVKADFHEWFPGTGLRMQGEEVEFVYSANSRFYDVLLVSYHHGCPDSMVKKNLIQVLDPTAKFLTFSGGCNDDSLFFDNKSFGGHKFQWFFGDGDSTSVDSVNSVSHIYDPGQFTARLVAY
ncbi:MAG: PKD domain-containing protein, partial [Bacteroidota bacterium]|nr:PKD domain-containing protein [Bacteroidota bacterium]MDX5430620.1 PKD domain-containing protein [Bacteroidota bacterium]MDX5469372.1 PKD domain-containing protein [Bacteroidota bacterium]